MTKLFHTASTAFAYLITGAIALGLVAIFNPSLLPRTPTAEATATSAPGPAEAPVAAPVALVDVSQVHAVVDRSGPPLQCAIYARQRTGFALTGAARNWWPQADGRYRRAASPSAGSVIVMGGTEAGHVALVTQVLNGRQIVVDHANWLGGGEIITGALVEDASPNNDWSAVRVWNVETNSMGIRAYPVFGFVGPQAA